MLMVLKIKDRNFIVIFLFLQAQQIIIRIMWQRVQTLYLAIATALIAVLFFCNMAASYDAEGNVTEYYTYTSFLPYLILTIALTLLGILALTTFKVRIF